MHRTSLFGRFGRSTIANKHVRAKYFHPRLEALEERQLLTASALPDLLIATFDDTHGSSVLRYNQSTDLRVPTGVYTGNHGLGNAEGLVVAPDGTFYVSSLASFGVLHYSNEGNYLGTLGAGDAVPAPIAAPGTLAFGPNGHLYVGDLTGKIFQFDLTSSTQQYLPAATLNLGYTPGGIAFAPDASHDLIVGGLDTQGVTRYASNNTPTVLIAPGSGITPAAILPQANGNLLIADIDFGAEPTSHHQIMRYDAVLHTTSQFINLTTPVGTGAASGNPPQPTSMIYDQDGNLLVGMSPDHNGNGAIEKFDINTGALLKIVVSGIGTPAGLAFITPTKSDLAVSTYDDTAGSSVLRYNEATLARAPGGVATGNNGLAAAEGLAVAPDGSFYVSGLASHQVLHYSNAGLFLNVLGAGDAVQSPLVNPGAGPGTLIFGPNGRLYVGDLLQGAIYQFDTLSTTQQYIAAATLNLGYSPGGIAFAPDLTHDLIVGGLDTQGVTRYASNLAPTPLINPGSGITPTSILPKFNGDLLIADTDFGFEPLGHHQIVRYDAILHTTSQFINLTTPVGTGASAGLPPQPTSLMYDHDGQLLVGLSPDHNGNGAIERFNITTGALLSTPVAGIGTPAGLAFIPSAAAVANRQLFYGNSSRYDVGHTDPGNNPRTPLAFSDDNAVATDKVAYLPNGSVAGNTTVPATLANISSYSRGINGIMVDLAGIHGTITSADFTFRVGNDNTPSTTWTPAPAPTAVFTRPIAGTAGSDRVEIVWSDNVIQKQWLEVIVQANANTGLAAADTFFFGSAPGDSVSDVTSARVDISDELSARNNPKLLGQNIPISNIFDYNRDGMVNILDQLIARNNQTLGPAATQFIRIDSTTAAPGVSPFASTSASTTSSLDARLTAALAISPVSATTVNAAGPTWLALRLDNLTESANGSDHALEGWNPAARSQPAVAHSARVQAVLAQLAQDDDLFGFDDLLPDPLRTRLRVK